MGLKIRRQKSRSVKIRELPQRYEPGFLAKLDSRCAVTKEIRRRFNSVCDDLGGAGELSYLQRMLVERAVFMEAIIQGYEHQLATAQDRGPKAVRAMTKTLGRWVQGVNCLTGLCGKLGLKRKAKVIDLKSYVGRNGKER